MLSLYDKSDFYDRPKWLHHKAISLVRSKETYVACHLEEMPSSRTFVEPCISWLYASEYTCITCISRRTLLPQTLTER